MRTTAMLFNQERTVCSAAALVIASWIAQATNAEISLLRTNASQAVGIIQVHSDEFGAFGSDSFGSFGAGTAAPSYRFGNSVSGTWMFFSGLMVANAFDYQWFANEDHWAHQVDTVGTRRALSELTAGNVISDLVSDDRTTRTSQFRLDIENLEVQLVQEAPVAGFNFVQSYQLTNSGTEPVSANIVWYADADLAFEQDPFAANVPNDTNPRTYFIEESDVGEGDPSVDDRERRIRCGSKPVHE